MMGIFLLYILVINVGVLFAGSPGECLRRSISIEQAVRAARQYSGEPFKAWLSYSKRSGYCYWKVKGSKGYVIIDARSGEIVRFYRNRR
jgi:hypothetical protein